MAYLGRFQLGQTVPLTVLTTDAAGTASAPTRAPSVELWSDSAFVERKSVPILDRYYQTGLFRLPLRLTSSYAAGRYRATYSWNVSSHVGMEEDVFEVVAGGDVDGIVQSMFWAEFPHADFLLHHAESGTLVFGRNPSP